VIEPAQPYVLRMEAAADPLKRFEEALPHSREGLLQLWTALAPRVRKADRSRYCAVQEALKQDIPFPILVLYVFRECRRALDSPRTPERAGK
jgi:hypothetical protein